MVDVDFVRLAAHTTLIATDDEYARSLVKGWLAETYGTSGVQNRFFVLTAPVTFRIYTQRSDGSWTARDVRAEWIELSANN